MSLEDAFADDDQPLPVGTTVVVVHEVAAPDGAVVPPGTAARVQEPWGTDGRAREGLVSIATLGGVALEVPRAALVLQRGGATPPTPPVDRESWERYRGELQLVTLVGSRAWNLSVAGSDEDRRGFWLAPFGSLASLSPAPEQIEDPESDGVYWELEKLLKLALRADPNAIECLYGPVVTATPFGERVRAARDAFLSRRVLDTFGRYALAQLERLEARERRNALLEEAAALLRDPGASWTAVETALADRLEARGQAVRRKANREAKDVLADLARSLHDRGLTPDRHPRSVEGFLRGRAADPQGWLSARSDKPKNAMHLLRILHSGLQLLQGGGPLIRVPEGPLRDHLLEVRQGRVPFADVIVEARQLAARLEAAAATTALPAEPDRAAAEALLLAGRRRAHPWAPGASPPTWPARPAPLPPELPADLLRRFLASRAVRPFIAAISGSHAYGFASPDSDVDLKGLHLAPTGDVVGVGHVPETADHLGVVEGREIDWTSHELAKGCRMLLKGNGNVLEWVLGELVVVEHPRAGELRALARRTLHRGYARHYAGFSRALLEEYLREKKSGPGRAKPLLYALRTALTGVHLLASGECEPSLPRLLERYPAWARTSELIELKRTRRDAALIEGDDAPWLALIARAQRDLEEARGGSPLPEEPPFASELSAWLAELRLSDG